MPSSKKIAQQANATFSIVLAFFVDKPYLQPKTNHTRR